MYIPAYLTLSRHHIWYFRWPIPKSLHPQGKARQVRLSLRTRDPKEALRLAKYLEYHAQNIHIRTLVGMDYIEIQHTLKSHFSKLLAQRTEAIDKNGPLDEADVLSLQNTIGFIEHAVQEQSDSYDPATNIDDTITAFIEQNELDITEGSKAYNALFLRTHTPTSYR